MSRRQPENFVAISSEDYSPLDKGTRQHYGIRSNNFFGRVCVRVVPDDYLPKKGETKIEGSEIEKGHLFKDHGKLITTHVDWPTSEKYVLNGLKYPAKTEQKPQK